MQMHRNEQDAGNAFQAQVRSVLACGQPWMGLMFRVDPTTGILYLERTTYDFPLSRITDALELIKREATAELGLGPLDHSPLPLAAGFGIVAEDADDALPQPSSIAEAIGEI